MTTIAAVEKKLMSTQAIVEGQYQQILSAKNLKRPVNLAEVKIKLHHADDRMPDNLVEQFQNLLDCECAKPAFFDEAVGSWGFRVLDTDNFMADIAEIRLYSVKSRAVREDWVDVSYVPAGPGLPGNPQY
jgi:hypothetical protein